MKQGVLTLITAFVGAALGGIGSTFLVESYYRPYHVQMQAELYKEHYSERINSYRNIMKMFSDVYWLERDLTQEPPETRSKRRLKLIQEIQRGIIGATPFMSKQVYDLTFKALDYYVENHQEFSPAVRRKWVDEFFDKLLNAVREDLGMDRIQETLHEKVFPEPRPG